MDDTPTKSSDISQSVWPSSEPGAACLTLASVGYEVQPAAAAPPSTKKLDIMNTNAGHMNQYDIMFSVGNAMSRAPIISGMVKFPKAPASMGMITKKIITLACIVNSIV